MIEPVSVPILLDVDLSVEEYQLDIDAAEEYDLEVETPVVVNKIDGCGVPAGGSLGDLLGKTGDDDYQIGWITPASSVEQDNTRPITSAAVYTEIGNINALLATI